MTEMSFEIKIFGEYSRQSFELYQEFLLPFELYKLRTPKSQNNRSINTQLLANGAGSFQSGFAFSS
jgi:hypothetical protein